MSQASKSNVFVDLYGLLKLEAMTNDRQAIESALRACGRLVKSTEDPAEKKRLSKLFELGKANLLDAKRKKQYDSIWQKELDVSKPSEERLDWDWEMLDAVLPAEPAAGFDLSSYLQTAAELPEADPHADFLKLQSLLTGKPLEGQMGNDAEASSKEVLDLHAPPATVPSPPTLAPPPAPPQPKFRKRKSGKKSLARSIRKKRDRSMYLVIGGMIASAAGLVGLLIVMTKPNENEPEVAQKEEVIVVPANPTKPQQPEAPKIPSEQRPPESSGLPNFDLADGTIQKNGDGMESMNQVGITSNNPAMPNDGMMEEPMVPDPMPEPEPEPEPEPPAVMLTEPEKSQWKTDMMKIRELLGKQDYKKAKAELDKQKKLAKTPEQEAQLIRLVTTADLAEQCYDALLDAMASMGPGATFQVKSNEIAFVEGSSERLVVRIGGTNKRYPLTEIPVGIVEGLVDLKLDKVNLRARAVRGAFILFHPKSNELVMPKARKMLEEAESEGRILEDTSLVFDDDYEL
ncbi:MAG: hypothetical protein AAF483_24735 [Planctomycetota bacterium]